MKGKKVLVTGASGFLGLEVALQLCKDGNEVYGLARFRDSAAREQLESAGARIIQKDVHTEKINDLPTDFDYVFSELAMVRNCDTNLEEVYDVNSYFVGRLMEHCHSASGIVLASTGGVYMPGCRAWDESGTISPVGTYAVSKFAGDVLGCFLCDLWQIPTCILRYFYPYGPTGPTQGFIHTYARQIAKGQEIPVNRNYTPRYNPIYIFDCVKHTINSAALCTTPAIVINIGGAEVISQLEMIAIMSQALGIDPKFHEIEEAPLFWLGDISLMKRLLGEPTVSLRDGIKKVVETVSRGCM